MKLRFLQKLGGSKVLQTTSGVLGDDWVDVPMIKEEKRLSTEDDIVEEMVRLRSLKSRDKTKTYYYYFLISPDIAMSAGWGYNDSRYVYGCKIIISSALSKGTIKLVAEEV